MFGGVPFGWASYSMSYGFEGTEFHNGSIENKAKPNCTAHLRLRRFGRSFDLGRAFLQTGKLIAGRGVGFRVFEKTSVGVRFPW